MGRMRTSTGDLRVDATHKKLHPIFEYIALDLTQRGRLVAWVLATPLFSCSAGRLQD